MVYRELQLSVALNVYRYYTHPFNCKMMFFLDDWNSLAIRNWQLDLSTHWPRPQTRKPHAFISPLPLLLLLFLKAHHHQATELALLLQQQLLLSFTSTHMVVMVRHVLDVAGLAQLSKTFSSLAHSQCCHILLGSGSRPSSSPLDKISGVAPHHRAFTRYLSVAHCFSSTSTTVHASLSPSINRRSIIDQSLILMMCDPQDPW